MRKFLELIILMGQVRKGNIRDYWFTDPHSPKQELSFDEAMIARWGPLKFRTYNPGKITKHAVLVRRVCEAVLGYICNMEIYSAARKKLEDTVLSLLDRNLGQNHHIYQDNFYNSMRLAQTLLDRNVRVCGTMRANRGIPCDLEGDGKCLKKGQSVFQRKGDVMVQVWKDKRLARMISTIHEATIVNTGQRDRKTNMEIKKPYAVVQYNKFIKA